MSVLLLGARLLLLAVFASAAIAKLCDRSGTRTALEGFGAPDWSRTVLTVLLPAVELVAAGLVVPVATARFGGLLALALLAVFSAAVALALGRGRELDCNCFGQVHSAPVSWRTLARNLVLLGIAAFVVAAGWRHAGTSATHWVTEVQAAWLVAIAAGIVIVALVGFQVWFSLQLLGQNGRALERLEALERTLADRAGALPTDGDADDREPLGRGLGAAGLPVGTAAPEFELADLKGTSQTLRSLLGTGGRVMLVFSDAGCGPCTALMPDLARWQREHADRLRIAVVASGDLERNRAKAAEHGLDLVLHQQQREVSAAYQAHGTPTAVVIEPDGRIASPTVGGAAAIATLVQQAAGPALAMRQVPAVNPRRNSAPPAEAPPAETSRIGSSAPELVLDDLDGREVALGDLYGEPTVTLFWNPGCGFCQRMLSGLKSLVDRAPADAPRLVVISAGDPERVRQDQIPCTVLIDGDGAARQAFGAHGTPMGVLVADGKIASPIAAGADAVFELIDAVARDQGAPVR